MTDFLAAASSLTDSILLRTLGLIALLVIAATWTARKVIHWADIDGHTQAALKVEAADHGEPCRADVERGWLDEANEFWLFPSPEFVDQRTPIADGIDFEMWRAEMEDAS